MFGGIPSCALCGASDWKLARLRGVGFECQRCGVWYASSGGMGGATA